MHAVCGDMHAVCGAVQCVEICMQCVGICMQCVGLYSVWRYAVWGNCVEVPYELHAFAYQPCMHGDETCVQSAQLDQWVC